ncbi:MAG: hypothetical protein VXA18_02655 [Gammaproteobacteria bacterium]
MDESIKLAIIGWIIIIAFVVGRAIYRKQQEKKKYSKAVTALRKIVKARNDKEFIDANLELRKEIDKKNKLYFKSVDAALEYMEKFFKNYPIEKKHLYYGKVLHLDSKKTYAFVKLLCIINGKTDYAMATAVKSNELKKPLKKGDFVYVGIEDVGKVIPYKKSTTPAALKKLINANNTKGVIVAKASLGLDIKNSRFDLDE